MTGLIVIGGIGLIYVLLVIAEGPIKMQSVSLKPGMKLKRVTKK